jgi:hypothetical protein
MGSNFLNKAKGIMRMINKLQLILLITVYFSVFTDIHAQVKINGVSSSTIATEAPFMDASGFPVSNQSGKGLLFPRTDLTLFTFKTATTNALLFPTAYDGMIVYNIASGLTKSGIQVYVTPGFYYFSNPSSGYSTSIGTWIRISSGSDNGIISGSTNPSSSIGNNGDYYINTTNSTLFGPKDNGNWPNGITIIGQTGPQGQQGSQGIQGATGAQGPIGLTGAQGPKGDVGATGPQGIKGDQGIQGLKGDKGDTGDQGTQGLKGDQGTQGTTGLSAYQVWLNLGNTGTETDFINSLTGPKGLKGDVGATGATGSTGAQGPIGLTGSTGASGPQGIQGVAGINGQTSLIKTTTEVAGSNCSNGGVKVELGLDVNNNGILEISEINTTLTKYVCNGDMSTTSNYGARMQVFTSSGSFTVPNGVSSVIVEACGGGGGGGGGNGGARAAGSFNAYGGGGGASGDYLKTLIYVLPNETISVTIGQAGIGGSGGINCSSATSCVAGGNGTNGGNTIFGNYLTIAGGNGGGGGYINGGSYGNNIGTGGIAVGNGFSGNNGTVNGLGGKGGSCPNIGGIGGAAGSGPAILTEGGNGRTICAGGGGGGASSLDNCCEGGAKGGDGCPGLLIIYW